MENFIKQMFECIDTTAEKNNYYIVEDDTTLEIQIPVPGVSNEGVKAEVKNNVLHISIKETTFVKESKLTFEVDFKLKKKNINVFTEGGILYVIAEKPAYEDFEVEIG